MTGINEVIERCRSAEKYCSSDFHLIVECKPLLPETADLRMRDITALCNEIEELRDIVETLQELDGAGG